MKVKTIPVDGSLSDQQKLNIKEWIEALKSGKFKQLTHFLGGIDDEGNSCNCCLGVASEISDIPFTIGHSGYKKYDYNSNRLNRMPDQMWFLARYGFGPHISVVFSLVDSYNLSQLNDEGVNFSQIADIIQACFLDQKEIEIEISI